MASSSGQEEYTQDAQLWESLKGAIASSSGFTQWREERQGKKINFNNSTQELDTNLDTNLDGMVRIYLRETLATLAY